MKNTLAIPLAAIVIAAAMLCLLTPSSTSASATVALTTTPNAGMSVVAKPIEIQTALVAAGSKEAPPVLMPAQTAGISSVSGDRYAEAAPICGGNTVLLALTGTPAEDIMATRIDAQPTAGSISVSAGKTQILGHLVCG